MRQASESVFKFLDEHKIVKQLQKEIKESKSRRDKYELSQVWNVLISALEELVTICGDAYVTVDDYISLLRYAFCLFFTIFPCL